MRDRLADLVLACDGALESMRWTRHMRDAKNLQKGLVRMPALRKRMKAPLVMMPCRMPCDSTNGTNQTQQHALVAWHRLLAVPRTSLVKSSALLSSETNSSRQRSHVCQQHATSRFFYCHTYTSTRTLVVQHKQKGASQK